MTGFLDEHGPFERERPAQLLGEVPYVHSAPRRVGRVGRRAAVAAGSLTVGALAAGGAAFAILDGADDPAVAVSALGASPSQTAEVTLDPSTRTEGVSRSDLRPGTCVRLDAAAVAAIEAARAAGPDAGADGRKVVVRLADGDVSVPVSALKVVRCTVPARSSATKAPSSSVSRRPAATSTSSTARRTTRPASATTRPRTTTTTKPRPTTTTPKSTTTTKSPTPKPTTTAAS